MTVGGTLSMSTGATGATLARLARERRTTTLVWAGLQLGDAGAAQLLRSWRRTMRALRVTALDLRLA